MRKDITMNAAKRDTRGKNEARRLRVAMMSPAVLYGTGKDPVAISISPKDVNKILRSSSGHNTIFNLDVQGVENTPAMIVDWQLDPVTDRLLHADLIRIDLTKRIIVKIPVHLVGEPVGVKQEGGSLEVVTREIEIECLPDDIPEHINHDVTALNVGGSVRASDVALSGSMVLIAHADQVIAHVVGAKAEEAAPAEGAAAVAEPEVIKKGKKEAEGEAPAADAKPKKK
jgi:large subunit ribosomal protein L25